MKLGVKEFRERFSELAEGAEPVVVTKNGRVVGTYKPTRTVEERRANWARISAELDQFREEWKASTPDWKERMASIGLGPDGESLRECD